MGAWIACYSETRLTVPGTILIEPPWRQLTCTAHDGIDLELKHADIVLKCTWLWHYSTTPISLVSYLMETSHAHLVLNTFNDLEHSKAWVNLRNLKFGTSYPTSFSGIPLGIPLASLGHVYIHDTVMQAHVQNTHEKSWSAVSLLDCTSVFKH
jgi:hypothetical protein